MLYTGLDIHKKTIYGTMMDKEGKIVDQKEFANCKEELELFLCSRPTRIVIEACGFWMDTYDKLRQMGYDVVLAHPGKAEAIASAKMKTDQIDSVILAHLLRSNLMLAFDQRKRARAARVKFWCLRRIFKLSGRPYFTTQDTGTLIPHG